MPINLINNSSCRKHTFDYVIMAYGIATLISACNAMYMVGLLRALNFSCYFYPRFN